MQLNTSLYQTIGSPKVKIIVKPHLNKHGTSEFILTLVGMTMVPNDQISDIHQN